MSISHSLKELGWANFELGVHATLLDLATEIGTPMPDPSGSMNRFLVAKDHAAARRNSASGIYGLSAFPLHTDYAHLARPPRYLLLRSHLGEASTATTLLNPKISLGSDWEELVRTSTWRISSGRSIRAGSMRISGTSFGFRWDPHLMRPLNSAAIEASNIMALPMQSSTDIHNYVWNNSSQVLLIDNWRVLHGRGNVVKAEHRCMERIFLEEVFCVGHLEC